MSATADVNFHVGSPAGGVLGAIGGRRLPNAIAVEQMKR
jgi:hypothetical protein